MVEEKKWKICEIDLVSPMVCRTQAIPISTTVRVKAIRNSHGRLKLIVESEVEECSKKHDMLYVAFRDVGCKISDSEGEYLDTISFYDCFHNVYIRQA